MSTIKVNKIENTSTTDGGISIDNSGHVTVDGQQLPTAGPLSNRNLVHNGAMKVAQRATSVTSLSTSSYLTDRWLLALSALGTWTFEQSTDAPTGFANSLKATCTTADASPAASDFALFVHRIEAQDLQHLEYGTSNAESLVLSFYVKSNKTGAASFSMEQQDNALQQFTKGYTINAANTWEHKKITIPGDAAGVIDNDDGAGLILDFWLNSGSTYTGGSHNAAWEVATQANRNADNLGVGGAVSDYFAITGVQLELGSNDKPTPFEHRSFVEELSICQRYFLKVTSAIHGGMYANSNVFMIHSFPTQMRAVPTVTATYVLGGGTLSTNFTGPGRYEQFVTGTTQALLGSNSEFSADL